MHPIQRLGDGVPLVGALITGIAGGGGDRSWDANDRKRKGKDIACCCRGLSLSLSLSHVVAEDSLQID